LRWNSGRRRDAEHAVFDTLPIFADVSEPIFTKMRLKSEIAETLTIGYFRVR